MIRLAALAAVLVLLCACAAVAQHQPPYATDRIIVKYRDPMRSGGVSPLPAGASVSVEWRFQSGAQLLRIGGLTVEAALAVYASDPRVEYAEPDYLVTLDQSVTRLPNDPRLSELYGMNNTGQTGGAVDADIDAAEAWAIQTGEDVLIGVIDTGIDWRHEDLAANVWVNPGEIPDNGVDDDRNGFVDDVHGWDFVHHDNDPMDDNKHGTHVSGTIAAVGNNGIGVAGVCWNARLIAIKTLDANGVGTMSQAIAGIEYATLMGARLTNNSWGTSEYSRALDDALAVVAESNALFVAAAGNSGRNNDLFPHYPSSYGYANIVAVASSDHNDSLSVTSNYGVEAVDLSAPGDAVFSLMPGDRYGALSGTSMATPHVAGTIGLILAEAPLMTAQQVKELLLGTVDPIPSMRARVLSNGRVNAYNALAGLDMTPPGRVDHLKVAETGSNTVRLTWTASGDDAGVGTAAAYDIRFADDPIKPSSFQSANRVEGCPAPAPAGERQSFRVTGLDVKTTYFFAMRALDERSNVSELSKVVAGRTRGTPEVSFSPRDFDGSVLTGASTTRTMHITNTGKGTIDFALRPSPDGVVWADPSSGTVPARKTAEITVVLDALGLAGGEHSDSLTLTTNDPAVPWVDIPAHLTVTSAPHVTVSESAIDFGGLFVGAGARREILVTNRGDRPLSVAAAGVAEADAGFSVNFAPVTLPPLGEHAIEIEFLPKVARELTARLKIASDDPDDSEVTVTLTGRGLPPPDIHVMPARLEATLHTGVVVVDTVTIVNAGANELNWNVSVAEGSSPDPFARADDEEPFRDLSGVRVLYDAAHRNLHWFNYNTMFRDLESRGAVVVVSKPPFTREYLDEFDVVWLADAFTPLTPEERDAVVAWVRAGGGLLLEGDYDLTVPIFNGLLRSLLSGIEISFDDGTTGITNFIEEHEITRGVSNVFLSYVKATLSVVRPPAKTIVYDIEEVPNTAWSRAGLGRLVVMADQNLANHRMGGPGNQIMGNRIFDWLALGVSWLSATPSSGVLAPSESRSLVVNVDAAGLGGPFDARLTIRSNDPDEPEVTVPVHLEAIPAADIVVIPPTVEFPGTAVMDTSYLEMVVGNVGVTDLEVTGAAFSTECFSVPPHAFEVSPGDVATLTLTYAPTVAGRDSAVLTLASNDPDEGEKAIAVTGDATADTPEGAIVATTLTSRPLGGLPERTALHANVPNPFNPATTIAYDVSSSVSVTLVIYDVRGRVVRTLVDKVQPAGRYTTMWQGTSDAGSSVATGIYFCRLVAGRFTQTMKMVLLK